LFALSALPLHVAIAEEASLLTRFSNSIQPAANASPAPNSADINTLHSKIRGKDASAADYLNLAATLRRAGTTDEAANILQKGHSKFPGNTEILRQLGIALIEINQPIEAVQVFDVLAAIQPDNAMAYNGKAVAFDTAGNHTAALEIYEKAISLAPDSVPIRNNMAMSLILDNQLNEAQAMLETLYAEAPDVAKVRHNLALVHGLKGNRKRAMEVSLQDLTQQQAEENLKFYQRYLAMQDDYKPVALMTQDGQPLDDLFTDTSAAEAAVAEKPAAAPQEKEPPSIAIIEKVAAETVPAAGSPLKPEASASDTANLPENNMDNTAKKIFGEDAVYEFPTGNRR
jgi:Flp pilus assembly protein TadD